MDIHTSLSELGLSVDIFDPWVSQEVARIEYGIELINEPDNDVYDGIILAVPHTQFIEMGADKIKSFGNKGCVFFDVKSSFPKDQSDIRL